MDGLSGMKIYQKFELDTDFLPSNYPTSLEFIIKGITHTIQNNEWITNIESIAIPKNPFGTSVQREKQSGGSSKSGNPTTSTSFTNPSQTAVEFIKKAMQAVFDSSWGTKFEPYENYKTFNNFIYTAENPQNKGDNLYGGTKRTTIEETKQILVDFLKGIGIKTPTNGQKRFVEIWRQKEGGNATWNLFNATLNDPDLVLLDSKENNNSNSGYPVKNYKDKNAGIIANIITFQKYTSILDAIKSIPN